VEHDNRVGHCEGYYDDDFKFHSRPSSMSNPIRNIRELCPHCLNWKTGNGCTCKICNDDFIRRAGEAAGEQYAKIVQEEVDRQLLDKDGQCRHAHTVSNMDGWTCKHCGHFYDMKSAALQKEIDDQIANIVRVPSKLVKAPSKERDYDGLREVLGRIVKRLYNVK